MTYLVHVSERFFAVDDSDVGDVEGRILDAVRSGGAFIEFDGQGPEPLRVLVTAASQVRIEKLPQPLEPPYVDGDPSDLAFFTDLDA